MAPVKKILVIEDEPEFRMAVRMRLEANGYEVIEAEDGVVGLDMARNKNPDLILLDIMLPKMDGYKVARLLKSDEKYRKIPIIVLTARTQQKEQETAMAVGGDAYMTKPYKPQEILDTIAKLLAERVG